MRINKWSLSQDKILSQATCAILVDHRVRGTAWLVSEEGYLLTAGHILGISTSLERVEVIFTENLYLEAVRVDWAYNRSEGVDYAVLKLVQPIGDRYPLPIALNDEAMGEMRLRGYGKSLRSQSVGRGTFLGSYFPQNLQENCLFQIRSLELGEEGYSGGAVYSDEVEAVVALQIEATTSTSGAGRDTVLAMPLYRIAKRWGKLFEIERESRTRFPPDIYNLRPLLAPLPIDPKYAHPAPPIRHWTDRSREISRLSKLWNEGTVNVLGLIGLGGVGKSSLVRRWQVQLASQNAAPDGFFWWSFCSQPTLDEFLDAVLIYLTAGRINISELTSPWVKIQHLIALLHFGRFIVVLDGLEVMQNSMETTEDFGRLEDVAFRSLLGSLAEKNLHGSLILITSRHPLTDLDSLDEPSYLSMKIDSFSNMDGAEYLRRAGVKGTKKSLEDLSDEYGGHALSLLLLATYLNDYFGSNSYYAREIPYLPLADNNKVNQVLHAYNGKLSDPQRHLMQLLSVFRSPVERRVLEDIVRASYRPKNIPLFDNLSSLTLFELRQLIVNLYNRGLISRKKDRRGEWQLAAGHQIVREYFNKQLADALDDYRSVNLHLRNHARELPVHKPPRTFDDLTPLYDTVYYTCQAGLFDEALKFFRDHLSIGEQGSAEIAFRFGAYEYQKSFLRVFFKSRDLKGEPACLEKDAHAFLYLELGACCRHMGQYQDSIDFFERAASAAISLQDHLAASIACCELSCSQTKLGNLKQALFSGQKAIEFSELAGSNSWKINALSALGWTNSLLGDIQASEKAFSRARSLTSTLRSNDWVKAVDDLLKKSESPGPSEDLIFENGIDYATFLLKTGQVDRGLEKLRLNEKVVHALGWVEGIAPCERLHGMIEDARGNFAEAITHYKNGLASARKFGNFEELWKILIALGCSFTSQGRYTEAQVNLASALKILKDIPSLIGEVDLKVCLANLQLQAGRQEIALAEREAQAALDISNEIGYLWGAGNALHTLGNICIINSNSKSARRYLEKAYTIREKLNDPQKAATRKLLDQVQVKIRSS